jgi:hypothetical protein
MRWWWVALSDLRRPQGQRAAGVVIVKAHLEGSAIQIAMLRSPPELCHAGVEFLAGAMDAKYGDPPDGYDSRLLPNEEAQILADLWCGGTATQAEVTEAMLDDDAKVGDPLFRGRR